MLFILVWRTDEADSDDRLNLCLVFITVLLLPRKSSLVADKYDATCAATPGNYEETISLKSNKPNPAEREREVHY